MYGHWPLQIKCCDQAIAQLCASFLHLKLGLTDIEIFRQLSGRLRGIHSTRGAITAKKAIFSSVKTARNVPVIVSKYTATAVFVSPPLSCFVIRDKQYDPHKNGNDREGD